VLFNGVNLQQFRPDPAGRTAMRTRLHLEDRPTILYVGRVCRQKGTDVLLDAFQKLRQFMPQVQLVVAGPADCFGRQKGNGLTAAIVAAGGIYLGPVEDSELASVYNACDVFVMPTRQDEMFGMAALEAQACGKAVVCSRHGGLVEVVAPDSGRFFPPGDHLALCHELAALLGSSRQLSLLAQSARPNAERFAWPRLALQCEQIYCRLQAGDETVDPQLEAAPH
jgi:glycosyltransferase involved in cell wall biosynthesis